MLCIYPHNMPATFPTTKFPTKWDGWGWSRQRRGRWQDLDTTLRFPNQGRKITSRWSVCSRLCLQGWRDSRRRRGSSWLGSCRWRKWDLWRLQIPAQRAEKGSSLSRSTRSSECYISLSCQLLTVPIQKWGRLPSWSWRLWEKTSTPPLACWTSSPGMFLVSGTVLPSQCRCWRKYNDCRKSLDLTLQK